MEVPVRIVLGSPEHNYVRELSTYQHVDVCHIELGTERWTEIAIEEQLRRSRVLVVPLHLTLEEELNPLELLHLELFLLARNGITTHNSYIMPSLPRANSSFPQAGEFSLGEQFASLVGPTHPDILLLGDVHNQRAQNGKLEYKAAFGPWRGCGPWLLSTLKRSTWRRISLANANEDCVSSLVSSLDFPYVVALGRNAQKACIESGVSCSVVPHPQFAKRFLYRRGNEYGNLILEVAGTGQDFVSWRG